ncbi:hypothetical protein LTR81_007239 [Elasticomyces elasticus]
MPHGARFFLAEDTESEPVDLSFSGLYCILFDLFISHGLKGVIDMCDGSDEEAEKRFRSVISSDHDLLRQSVSRDVHNRVKHTTPTGHTPIAPIMPARSPAGAAPPKTAPSPRRRNREWYAHIRRGRAAPCR